MFGRSLNTCRAAILSELITRANGTRFASFSHSLNGPNALKGKSGFYPLHSRRKTKKYFALVFALFFHLPCVRFTHVNDSTLERGCSSKNESVALCGKRRALGWKKHFCSRLPFNKHFIITTESLQRALFISRKRAKKLAKVTRDDEWIELGGWEALKRLSVCVRLSSSY